jgi:type IX secretion system PorP/SprF family membrane protein
LLNPANAGLLPTDDYRVGINYRQQWVSVPVPYTTISAYGDFQAMRNKNQTNWLGAGLAFWNDKAGVGKLSLTRIEAIVAYHIQLGQYNMFSFGASGAYAQRTVDFSAFTFGNQWDGLQFNTALPTNENGYVSKTNYFDVNAGLNYAFFPNENTYLKVGIGMAHLNQPKESFYGQNNTLGMRPTINIDALFKLNDNVILNPSLYYTTQKGATELLYGTLFSISISAKDNKPTELVLGGFHRLGDAAVGVIGLRYQQWKIMSSYDFTVSKLGASNKGRGAFEMGLVFQALYNSFSRERNTYNCPRF